MNWASELFKNVMVDDFEQKFILVDDLVSAVLEKNKEIDKIDLTKCWEKAQALAFRELLEECKKAN